MIRKFSLYALTILALAACQPAQVPELDLNENSVRDDVEALLKEKYKEDNAVLFSAMMNVAAATELSIASPQNTTNHAFIADELSKAIACLESPSLDLSYEQVTYSLEEIYFAVVNSPDKEKAYEQYLKARNGLSTTVQPYETKYCLRYLEALIPSSEQ